MTIVLSDRTLRIKPSATMAVNAKAQAMRRAGIDIINLSVGEPDFETPAVIKQAGIDAINAGMTHYTSADGLPELKSAIQHKLQSDNELSVSMDEIIVTPGAKQAIYNATQAVLNAQDEAIIPAPYWVSYAAMVELADATPVIVPTTHHQQFKITPQQLEHAITDKTKLVFLNSPSNPTGMVYSLDEFKALGAVLAKHPNILILVDDIYEYILWSQPKFYTFLNACPELKERTILINGVSKAYAMTGWRIGYSVAPAAITNAMKKVQSHSASCACSISQMAAAAALKMNYQDLHPMYNTFHERHDLVISKLREIDGIEVQPADGAFYVFPYVATAMQRLGCEDDVAFANYLLEHAHVATVPGEAFGAPGYIRLSCAAATDQLNEAMDRLIRTINP